MPESEDTSRSTFDHFKELYSQARSEGGTGDASLDMLLLTVRPPFSRLIQGLAVPHWFDEEVIAAMTDDDLAVGMGEVFEDIRRLPFVRLHPRGHAYHDLVREALRQYLARTDHDRLKALSRRIVEILTRESKPDGAEEIKWERIYHTLAYDEAAGFEAFDALFMEARRNRRFTVCDTLVHMASEQRPLLSPHGSHLIDYYGGLLAFDLHRWGDAETIFQRLPTAELPPSLAGRIQLYRGLTLEAKGMWRQAEQVYQDYLKRIRDLEEIPELSARFHQRLAQTYLSEGNLKKAEVHAQRSLAINQRNRDRFGEALNFETIGAVYGNLRDLPRAQEALEKSLAILDEAGRAFDKAKICSDLANLYLLSGRWEDAEQYYRQALQIKVDAGDNYGLAFIYSNLGQVCVKRGDIPAGLRHFSTSLRVFDQFKDRLNSAKTLRNIAITYEHLDDVAAALDHMRQAVEALPAESPWMPAYRKEIRRLEKQFQHGKISPWRKIGTVIGIVVLVALLLTAGLLVLLGIV